MMMMRSIIVDLAALTTNFDYNAQQNAAAAAMLQLQVAAAAATTPPPPQSNVSLLASLFAANAAATADPITVGTNLNVPHAYATQMAAMQKMIDYEQQQQQFAILALTNGGLFGTQPPPPMLPSQPSLLQPPTSAALSLQQLLHAYAAAASSFPHCQSSPTATVKPPANVETALASSIPQF